MEEAITIKEIKELITDKPDDMLVFLQYGNACPLLKEAIEFENNSFMIINV